MTKNYDAIDLAKFILSIIVCGIHALGRYGIYPFFRIAVPLFFIISSYFFFKKLNAENDSKDGHILLKNFAKRNAKLYLFWFVLLLPITLFNLKIFSGNVVLNLVKLAAKAVFASTFVALGIFLRWLSELQLFSF